MHIEYKFAAGLDVERDAVLMAVLEYDSPLTFSVINHFKYNYI